MGSSEVPTLIGGRMFTTYYGWRRRHRRVGVVAAAAVLAMSPLVLVASGGAAVTANTSTIVYAVHPIAVQATSSPSAGFIPSQCIAQAGLACYDPQILHTAYQIPWTINGQLAGSGEQIAIIDAYGSPTVASDLATFDAEFGLPPATLHVYYPSGQPTYNPLQHAGETGWAEETSLDVQTAHALAPGATINLIVAASPNGNDLNVAENYAVTNHLGNVMSMSFGAPEAAIAGGGNNLQLQQANTIFQQATIQENMSVFASSGDSGATNGYTTANALFPASDPFVTAAGGTDLFVKADTTTGAKGKPSSSGSTNGTYVSEYAWNDANANTCPFGCDYGPFGATGGAPSSVFAAPSYQQSVTGSSMRTTSDVSFNASVYTATMIYLGFLGGANNGFYFFGGTSESSPSWAAITADLAQARGGGSLGAMNPILYKLAANPRAYAADFHDVTVGTNNFPAGSPGFPAGTGYDLPTGLGTPIVTGLIHSLAPHATYSLTQP